ncbi:RNA polymerase subunit sigma-70 [Tengunoibacter tsumagoiensis]|uniref:RNA polymerase sigma factor n=1 Tax=Tengunoibacter tsumagoiensis TaxID=2014871 RepID=A0A401ZY51_9CHLR|nr:RNA polymerase subunit sigma-70 [Tengunoibacter tsumagoiensis]GCE11769.1 RNA polymerase sigma factor [Tengunoibacter tsumagoiensis]
MTIPPQGVLLLAVQAGDQHAFECLVEPYQRELLTHCYRMLGSYHDAEDLVQETLLRAWEKRASFTDQGSYRAWLYRIATNLCLNMLTRSPRRSLPPNSSHKSDPTRPLPRRASEPIWLEPFPDELEASYESDPEEKAMQSEYIRLAFLTAIQQLTPTQRAILLLRGVLDWEAREVAEWLNLSVVAVNSGLQRARHTLRQHQVLPEARATLPPSQLQPLLQRYVTLWEQGDISGLVGLMREDAWFTMPPIPAWFQGRKAIETLFRTSIFSMAQQWRLLPTHANASPAFGLYKHNTETATYQLFGLLVLDFDGELIANTVTFLELHSLLPFALPDTFPAF